MSTPKNDHGLAVTSSYLDQPDPLVVLLHGALDRAAGFARSVRHLGPLPVLRYDRRGYGRSRTRELVGIEGHVADLFDLIANRRAVVVGHSFGGVVALCAAQQRPEQIIAVGAFESPMTWQSWWPGTTPGATAVDVAHKYGDTQLAGETFMIRLIGKERWMALPDRVKSARRAEGATLVTELESVRFGKPPYNPSDLQVPVLSGYGTLSKPHMIKAAGLLAEEAPKGELMVFEQAGHGAHLSHPKRFAEFVLRAVELSQGRGESGP